MGATFKEIGRVRASESTELVLSEVIDNGATKGINFNTFITSDSYTGFTKGTLIPVAAIKEFAGLVAKAAK